MDPPDDTNGKKKQRPGTVETSAAGGQPRRIDRPPGAGQTGKKRLPAPSEKHIRKHGPDAHRLFDRKKW